MGDGAEGKIKLLVIYRFPGSILGTARTCQLIILARRFYIFYCALFREGESKCLASFVGAHDCRYNHEIRCARVIIKSMYD